MRVLRPREVVFFGRLFIFQFTQLEKTALQPGQPPEQFPEQVTALSRVGTSSLAGLSCKSEFACIQKRGVLLAAVRSSWGHN